MFVIAYNCLHWEEGIEVEALCFCCYLFYEQSFLTQKDGRLVIYFCCKVLVFIVSLRCRMHENVLLRILEG